MADHEPGNGYNPDIPEDTAVLPPTLNDTQSYLATLGVGMTGELHHMPCDELDPKVVVGQRDGIYYATFDAPLSDYHGTSLTDEQIRKVEWENT